MKMKKITKMAITMLFSLAVNYLASADAWDNFIRQQVFESKKYVDEVMSNTPKPGPEDRTMSYHVGNASGSRIKALYFRGEDSNTWSGNCLVDTSTCDWINSTALYVHRSGRLNGSPVASMRTGERQRDLNGNYWWSAGYLTVDVPLGGYDGYAYRMKVYWEDGTVREFRLPYPWGDVTIYKNQVKVYLGVSGRGLFHRDWIAAD